MKETPFEYRTIILVVAIAALLITISNTSQRSKENSKIIVEKMELTPLYQGEGSLAYWIDSTTMICYATSGAHGFTCIPCDSLKRLK